MKLTPLPIDSFLEKILQSLKENNNLVLVAAPGAGKTTRLPPALMSLSKKKILVLEPRRVAALGAASRIAEENQWSLGQEVGYQVRFENKTHAQTQLIFLTEALLNRKLLQDPSLKDVDIVVLDEFHERSLYVDLSLGCLKELQELERPDLKIVVMSATLNAQKVSKYLNDAPVIEVPGQTQPLELIYSKEAQLLQTNTQWLERVCQLIKEAKNKTTKDILVFVPGIGEIERLSNALAEWSQKNNLQIKPLHGSLSLEAQKEVLKSSSQQKIVIATNVAESSITLDGLDTVIDSGLARQMNVHPKTGFAQLLLQRISKSSATQRSGRAARQFPGKAYRMWAKMDELSMPDQEIPEIMRSDLSEALLFLSQQGISDFENFSWFEKPQSLALQRALLELRNLSALDENNKITDIGKRLSQWPLPPRLSRLMLAAQQQGLLKLGADLCALLLEKDLLERREYHSTLSCDLSLRLEALEAYRQGKNFPGLISSRARQIDRSSEQLVNQKSSAQTMNSEKVQNLLFEAFADRLCRLRREGEDFAILRQGRGVKINKESLAKRSTFFLALNLADQDNSKDTLVSLASGLDSKKVLEKTQALAKLKQKLIFDDELQKIFVEEAKHLDEMPLENPRRRPASQEEAQQKLTELAFSKWDFIVQKNEALQAWMKRFSYFIQKKSLPELSEESLLKIIEQACFGENSLNSLFEKDLIYFFESTLESSLMNELKKQCPTEFIAPTGKRFKIHYEIFKDPYVEVKIQELFGLKETPQILNNTIPLTFHLLGPNYRPVQVTQDLASFWKNGYPEVRKELRARYPKHKWPEDPF